MTAVELLVFYYYYYYCYYYYSVALSRLKPCRNVKIDLSGTIHSAGYKFRGATALQPESKCSLQYMPLNFQ